MWLIPAKLSDARLLSRLAIDPEMNFDRFLPEATAWRGDPRRVKRSLAKVTIFMASEPTPGCRADRELVGVLVRTHAAELSWAVCPGHRGKGVAKRMVRLAAHPGYLASVLENDAASQHILHCAGFDLIKPGPHQLWRADRVLPYC